MDIIIFSLKHITCYEIFLLLIFILTKSGNYYGSYLSLTSELLRVTPCITRMFLAWLTVRTYNEDIFHLISKSSRYYIVTGLLCNQLIEAFIHNIFIYIQIYIYILIYISKTIEPKIRNQEKKLRNISALHLHFLQNYRHLVYLSFPKS